jgi:uncharacterized protein YceK
MRTTLKRVFMAVVVVSALVMGGGGTAAATSTPTDGAGVSDASMTLDEKDDGKVCISVTVEDAFFGGDVTVTYCYSTE